MCSLVCVGEWVWVGGYIGGCAGECRGVCRELSKGVCVGESVIYSGV